MTPRFSFADNFGDLLKFWLEGAPLSSIRERFSDGFSSIEELGILIEDLFGYKLPWGTSGFIRIALHQLELTDADLSVFAKYLPSMIKYGVPYPETAWLVSAGIPFGVRP